MRVYDFRSDTVTLPTPAMDAPAVQTNIVNCFAADAAAAIHAGLRERGVLANSRKTRIRLVTHCDVDDAAVDAALAALADVLSTRVA